MMQREEARVPSVRLPRRPLIALLLTLFWVVMLAPKAAHAQQGDASPALVSRAETMLQNSFDALGIDVALPAQGMVILVNVPSFELLAIEDGRERLRSRIIVGTPWNRTPLIDTATTVVRFRPTWRPTPSMVASGEHVDRIWPPGPGNPLGLAAIRLEPPLLVYLHDTNHPELFEQEVRALSHGCIRVEKWDELISWLLQIPLEQVHALANGDRTLDWPAPPVPMLIRYYTRFPDPKGRPVEHADIYDRDLALLESKGPCSS